MPIYYENGLWLGLFRDDFREEDLKVEEKQNPTECKYCGCSDIRSETDSAIHFKCFSSYWHDDDEWNISNNCGARCAVQLVKLRERVQRAVEVLEGATRFDFIASYMCYMAKRSDGEFLEYEQAEQALEILRGNSPESPESSPITTDDLAASDYYEAVRQQVPWMVSIEHIEDLVEAYRVSGLMVWKAAEEIRKVHGGEYGQAE